MIFISCTIFYTAVYSILYQCSHVRKVSIMPEMTMFPGTWNDILPGRNIFSPVSGWKAESYSRFACQRLSSVVPGGHSPRLRLVEGSDVCV